MDVLISGASVAGPAVAYWLGRHGFRPTVVEIAPALREGGYAVDFRSPTHLAVLERMGVLDELRARQTGGSSWHFVDETGRERLYLPPEFAGGEVELLRADLSRVLYERSRDKAEYVFGDTVVDMTETADGVEVAFERGPSRRFDLVIGADGMHSAVRRLAFGPEERFVSHLGYYVAGWDFPNRFGLGAETVLFNAPGRLAGATGNRRDPARASTLFVFASERLDYDRHDLDEQKELLRAAFADLGWQVPRLLDTLRDASDLYFDAVSRVDVASWSAGRVALVGDAACGATFGGMGTGAAIVAAYVLVGELVAAGGDHRIAFPRYEGRLRAFAQRCQQGGARAGKFLAPRTRLGLELRNRLLSRRLLLNAMLRVGRDVSTVDLPDYAGQPPANGGRTSSVAPSGSRMA